MDVGEKNSNSNQRCLIDDAVGEELLSEILIRLPLDEIFRCKSVCKRWLSLIQDPLFAAYYTKKQREQSCRRCCQGLSCHLGTHPQQRSAILVPTTTKKRKRPAFSLDFVPDFPRLHGADNYSHLLQRDEQNKEEKKQKLVLGSSNGLRVNLSVGPILTPDGDGDFYSSLKRRKRVAEMMMKKEVISNGGASCYYTTRDLVLGSSNGLLLCAPLLSTPPPRSRQLFYEPVPVLDDFPPIYVVCNPHTKQWLQIPAPPPFTSSQSAFPHAANVGFVSGFDSGRRCWFKIVRLALHLKPCLRRSLKLQVFSSRSWKWAPVTTVSLPGPIGSDDLKLPIVAVTLLNGTRRPRLCWLLNKGTQAIIYDPTKNVVDAVVPKAAGVVLDAMCVSRGALWGGKLHAKSKLRIYRLPAARRKEWEMVREFDMMQFYNPNGDLPIWRVDYTWKEFLTMDPGDPQQVYLKSQYSVALLNLRSGALKVVGALDVRTNGILKQSTIICDDPPWPTSLPSPPSPYASS